MTDTPPAQTTPKTGPNNTVKFGALLIIGIMVLSGAAILFAGQTPSSGNNSNGTDPNAGAAKTYHADDIQGQVTQVFSSAVVGAQTSVSDKTVLDEALLKVPHVKAVDSQFTKLDANDSLLTYVANVSVDEMLDKQAFVSDVQSISQMQSPEIYFQAAISVSPTLNVKDESNKDTTITLPNSVIQAIVFPDTQVGNTISGQFVASFQGDQLVSAYVLESQNISLSPTPISVQGTYTLSALQPQLSIAGSFNYWPDFDENVISTGLKKVNGILSVAPPLVPSIGTSLGISGVNVPVVQDDVNAYILAHPTQYTSFTVTTDTMTVGLGTIPLQQAKEELTNIITQSAAANVTLDFSDPLTQFLVDVNVAAGSTTNVEASIHSYFATWPVDTNIKIFQNGQVDANTLFISDLNQTVPVEKGVIPISVKPGHAIGDSILAMINGIVVNGSLVYVNGIESSLSP